MRTVRCFLVIFAFVATLLPLIARAEPQSAVEKFRFAFIYLHDEPAATKFQQLLKENGYTTDLIPLDDVTATKWAEYSAVIVGSDIEKAWSTPAAKAIADAKVPVLGLGEGGYYFFGKLNLDIGSPHGWHGGDVGVRAALPTKSAYWTADSLNIGGTDELMLYSSTSHVGIFLPKLGPGAVPVGYELGNNSHAPIIEEGRFVLWGFTESPEKMTPLGKQMFVHTCRYVARAGRTETDENPASAPESKSQLVFIYLNENESTESFKQLLTSNGLTVDMISLQDVLTTDFAPYQAVVAGPDIERAWSDQAAKRIAASKKPVLGLGEGGSALFEKFQLDIGWMHTYHGGEVGVSAANHTDLSYWTSADLDPTEADELMLYSSTGHVAVFLRDLSPGVVPLGYELKNKSYAPIIEQDRRYLLWGFRESPLKMTPLGKQLFVHTCRYVVHELASEGKLETTATTSRPTPADDSLTSLSQRVRLLETKVSELETSRQAFAAAEKVTSEETASEPSADQTSNRFQGVWLNIKGPDKGVPKVVIEQDDAGWTVRAFGACEPTDCDWGATQLHLLGDSVAAQTFPYGFAKWNHGFAEVNATLALEDDQLVVGLYEVFKDDSGRSNYRTIARYRRDNSAEDSKRSNSSDDSAKNLDPKPENSSAAVMQLQSAASSVINLTQPLDGVKAVSADDSLALYFAFGPVSGPATLVQVDWDGSVRGSLELPYSISGLAPDRDRLLATVGSARVGEGRVIAIDQNGALNDFYRDRDLLPDTIEIWSTADSDEVLVADNGADVIVALPKDGKTPARKLIQIEGHEDFQSMSVAKCSDGRLLYSGSDLNAVYRVALEDGPTLCNPLIQGQAAVCADPNSSKWVAAQSNELHVFDGNQQIASFPYPEGRSMRRTNIAFLNDGQLVLGLDAGRQLWVYAVNVETGEFHGLFSLRADRVTGLAIAPKMDW
jgi:hypothetical protein